MIILPLMSTRLGLGAAANHVGAGLVVALSCVLVQGCGGRPAVRLQPDADSSRGPAADAAVRVDAEREPARPGAGGVTYPLKPGQTLYSMARVYGVPVQTLMRVNGITDPRTIPDGTPIFIPGVNERRTVPLTYVSASLVSASLVAPPALPGLGGPGPAEREPIGAPPAGLPRTNAAPRRTPAPLLAWPIRGAVTSRFGPRGRRSYHEGIDIRGVRGEVVQAAAAGVVVRAGTGRGYGKLVVIEHGDGLSTLYAHASRLLVREGDRVGAGDPIAEVGRTGNARGAHLHFEVRRDGRAVDPRPLLDAAARARAAPPAGGDDGEDDLASR